MDGISDELFKGLSGPRAARFVTERELSRTFSIPRTTLWRLRKSGLPTVRFGRSIRYDVEKVKAWLAGIEAAQIVKDAKAKAPTDGLSEPHWSLSVALDPKHRPQEPSRPSSTVRREWWRYPQEAHLFDRHVGRYRRLVAAEVAVIQGFPENWGAKAVRDDLLRIRGYGDAVPPQLSAAVFSELPSLLDIVPKTGIEVCAGFGGMALGEARALGLQHLALMERWDVACEVLRHSGIFDPKIVREVDLHDVDWSEFRGRVDLLTGGPPCQPWSQGGQGLGADDERDLLGTMPDTVGIVQPLGFVFENVPGLLSGENELYAKDLVERFRHAAGPHSYGVALAILNAADFGIAQTRRRVFIVGARGKTAADIHRYFDRVFARRTHAHPRVAATLDLKPWKTIADVVTDWTEAKALWRRWPIPAAQVNEEIEMADAEGAAKPNDVGTIEPRVRIGLEWPSRGAAVRWQDGVWTTQAELDTTVPARAIPLLPHESGGGDPVTDPWLLLGDPCIMLDALHRQVGREASLVYVDLPRIKTNAGTFDAANRERILDTWLSVVRAILRRAVALLADRGAIAVLCGIDETPYAHLLLDELAGAQNHLGTVAWEKNYSPRNMPNMRELSPVHDNIVLYARRLEALPSVALRLPATEFANSDKDPRGSWKAEQKGANKPDCDYEVHICPYRWEIVEGVLPPGLWRINPKTGVIWGTPNVAGTWTFKVRATDRTGESAEKTFKIKASEDADVPPLAEIPWLIADRDSNGEISSGPNSDGKLRITTKSLIDARVGAQYSVCIVAAGGSPWIGTTRPGKTSTSGKSRYWEFPATTLLTRAAEDSVDFKSKDDAIPALKTYEKGGDRSLNQTTMWFARGKMGDENSQAIFVDYAQDAKKELEALVRNSSITSIVATSKPARLMTRLLALFSTNGATVIDVGSPAAEMASMATAVGRRAVYVAMPPDEKLSLNLWEPRLRLAARGEHPIPEGLIFSEDSSNSSTSGYILNGQARKRTEKGDVFILRSGPSFADVDAELGTVMINYRDFPAGSPKFLAALASVEGLVPTKLGKMGQFATTRDGRLLGIYVPPNSWLEQATIEEIGQSLKAHLDNGGRVRVYMHRGVTSPDRLSDNRIEIRRIPFALLLAAGTT